MLAGIADQNQAGALRFHHLHQLFQLARGQEPILINDDHLASNRLLQGGIDQEPLDRFGLTQDLAGRCPAVRLLDSAIIFQEVNRLGARSEAGDLPFYPGHALDGGRESVRLACTRPPAEDGDAVE